MRARKPCVRARRTLDGWYVRFIFAFELALVYVYEAVGLLGLGIKDKKALH